MADPTSNATTPLQGKTSIDDKMFFDPERLSYESATDIAGKVAYKVRERVKNQVVVIAGTRLLADFANLQAIYAMLDELRREYGSIADQAQPSVGLDTSKELEIKEGFVSDAIGAIAKTATSAITPVTSLVGAALGLVSLFRQDVEYHGEKTVVDALAFEIALAAKVHHHGATTVFVPDLSVLPALEIEDSRLQKMLNQVLQEKAKAWRAVGPMISDLVRLEAELDEAAKAKKQDDLDRLSLQVSNMRRDLAPIADPLGRLDQRLSDLQNQLNQVEPTTGLIELARLLRAEWLRVMDPLYLHAAVVSSGGYYRITRNLFRTLFMGDGLSFSGGATVRWALLAKDGSVALGGIEIIALKGKFGHGSSVAICR
ncbi:MAG: hypothetical protein ABSE92_15245 [Terriglobales bacterium]|jgi:hypothetical protein